MDFVYILRVPYQAEVLIRVWHQLRDGNQVSKEKAMYWYDVHTCIFATQSKIPRKLLFYLVDLITALWIIAQYKRKYFIWLQVDRLSSEHQREVETLYNQIRTLEDQLSSVSTRSKDRIRQLESELEKEREEALENASRLQLEIK